MLGCIEESDAGPEEPPRQRRRVFSDADIVGSGKLRRSLEDLDPSKGTQSIPKNEFIDDWFSVSDGPRDRKAWNDTWNSIGQLPSPDGSARTMASDQRSAGSTSSRRSAASVYDLKYRAQLEKYNIYIMEEEPPAGLMEQAKDIVFRERDTPELDDAAVGRLRNTMRELQNEGEEDVKNRLAAINFPGFDKPRHEKLHGVSGRPWTDSVPVPLDSNIIAPTLPLPKPKPDKAFGYAKAAFNPAQLSTNDLLGLTPFGPSYASPLESLRFPFLIIEVKSQAKDGSVRVARNQAAGAGAVALNGLLQLVSRGPGLDGFDYTRPLFFSVTMDQEFAGVNVHWIGQNPVTKQHTFHLEELDALPLKYRDNIQVLQRAIKNIFDHGTGTHLKLIAGALDEYRKKIMAQRAADVGGENSR